MTPSPIGFVSTSASPACAPAFVSTRSGCTVPTTASPYFGSASSIEWPPATRHPRRARRRRRRRARARAARTAGPRAATRRGSSASSGVAAHRVDVGERVRRGDATPVVRVVDDRREEVGGDDDREVVAQAVDGGVVGGVEADEQVGIARRVGAEAAHEAEHRAQVGRGELARAARAVREAGEPDGFVGVDTGIDGRLRSRARGYGATARGRAGSRARSVVQLGRAAPTGLP